MKTNYQLDLTKSNFYDLVGFDKKSHYNNWEQGNRKSPQSFSRHRYP